MRNFLQLSLDLFGDVLSPAPLGSKDRKKEIKTPDAVDFISKFATENIANAALIASQAIVSAPAEPLAQVMRPSHFSHPQANREVRLQVPAGKRMHEHGGEAIVGYHFKRGKRKTIGFVVGADGLVVSAPRWAPLYEVDKALQDKAAWIVAKLAEAQERSRKQESAQISWKEGAALPFLGDQVILVLDPRQAAGSAVLHADETTLPGVPRLTLHLALPQDASQQRIRDSVQAWLMRQAKRIFEERLQHFAPQLGVKWNKLRLSNAESRWGSATSEGTISLNWRLIHFKQSVIDYVVVHELSHLRVMDHSPRFWSTVEAVLPNYAQTKQQLKAGTVPQWS
jgi:predicted metal-dependent hydrolase